MHVYEIASRRAQVAVPSAQGAGHRVQQVQRSSDCSASSWSAQRVWVRQPCTVEATATLGPQARGVATSASNIADADLLRLHAAGIRGARCYVLPMRPAGVGRRTNRSRARAALGWHVQVQLDGRELPKYEALLRACPADVVIDHNGKFLEPVPPGASRRSSAAAPARYRPLLGEAVGALRNVEDRRAALRGRSALARALATQNPERCVWASNWPHPGQKVTPSNRRMLDLLLDWAPDEAIAQADPRRQSGAPLRLRLSFSKMSASDRVLGVIPANAGIQCLSTNDAGSPPARGRRQNKSGCHIFP